MTEDLSKTQKVLSSLYWLCSNYGHSVGRPLASFLVLITVFGLTYSAFLPAGGGGPNVDVLQFCIEQIVRPFAVWTSGYESTYLDVTRLAGARWVATVQSAASLSLVGLFLVSLRRHFSMR